MKTSAAQGPDLVLRLFGALEARCAGAPLPGLHLREGERLLAYFTLHHGQPISYRMLAEQFWPFEVRANPGAQGDFPGARQAVYSLRRALGIEAQRLASQGKGVLSFNLGDADVDVIAFDTLAALDDPEAWLGALSLYRAPLLEGWDDPWAVQARARRRRSYERLFKQSLAEIAGKTDAEREAGLRRLTEAAPGEEEAWRELLSLLRRQDRTIDLESALADLYEHLGARGARPEAETSALVTALQSRSRQAALLAPRKVAFAPAPSERTPASEPTALSHAVVSDVKPGGAQIALLYKRDSDPDEALMRLLERELSAAGYLIFIDRHLSVGVEWAREIERQVRASYAVVLLLSGSSLHSEMLEHEVVVADEAAQMQGGLPRILPVRVAYKGALPDRSRLASILAPLHTFFWQTPEDNVRLAAEILRALQQPQPPRVESLRLEPVGGAVPLDSRFYVVRPTDDALRTTLSRQDSIVLVKGARQMGKTSLLARGLQQARQAGARVVFIDLQTLNGAQMATPDALMQALAGAIADQLDLDVDIKSVWNPDKGANMNLERFLRRQTLQGFAEPVVWGLDEVDRLFSCPFGSEVFGLFRSWHNRRSLDPEGPWSRLTLVLSYATEASLFITDANQSPFNVGTQIVLEDFTLGQVEELNRRYGEPLRSNEELARLHGLLSGQPYLTRRALDELVQQGCSLDDIESRADREGGPFGDHLRRVLAMLSRDPKMLEVVRDLLRGEPCPTPDAFYRLNSAGILAGEWGRDVRLRCRLYIAYLTRHLL